MQQRKGCSGWEPCHQDPRSTPEPLPAQGARGWMHPATLRITPESLEQSFWNDTLDETVAMDGFRLSCGIVTTYVAWHGASHVHDVAARRLIMALVCLMLMVLAGSCLCLCHLPGSYRRLRHNLALAQRAVRFCCIMAWCWLMTSDDWKAFLTSRGTMARELAVLGALTMLALHSVLQNLTTPLRFPIAAALQAPISFVSAWWCGRSLACALRTDPRLALQARWTCHAAQHAKQLALMAGPGTGGPPGPLGARLCDTAAVEVLLPLFCCLACLTSLYLTYMLERSRKERYLLARWRTAAQQQEEKEKEEEEPGRAPRPRQCGESTSQLYGQQCASDSPCYPLTRHLAACVCIVLASTTAGEAAAMWGRPFQCGGGAR